MSIIAIHTPELPERPTVVNVTYDDLVGASKGADFLDGCEKIATNLHDAENAGHDEVACNIEEHEGGIIAAGKEDIAYWEGEKAKKRGIDYERPRDGDALLGPNRFEKIGWFYLGLFSLTGGFVTLLISGFYVQDSGLIDEATANLWKAVTMATPVLFGSMALAHGIERIGNVSEAKHVCNRFLMLAAALLTIFVVVLSIVTQISAVELGEEAMGDLPLPDANTTTSAAPAWIGDILLGLPWGRIVMMATAILVEIILVALLKVHFAMKGWAGRQAIPISSPDAELADQKIKEIEERLVLPHARLTAARAFRKENASKRAACGQAARLLGQRILNERQARRDQALAQADTEIFDLDAYRRPNVMAAE